MRPRTLVEVHTGRHAALYCLGRLEEADEEYRTIERLCPAVLDRADATAVQVHSLTHRSRYAEALRLGLESLRELGITVPAADRLAAEIDHQFGYWYGGWTTPKPRATWPGRTSPTPRCSPRPA